MRRIRFFAHLLPLSDLLLTPNTRCAVKAGGAGRNEGRFADQEATGRTGPLRVVGRHEWVDRDMSFACGGAQSCKWCQDDAVLQFRGANGDGLEELAGRHRFGEDSVEGRWEVDDCNFHNSLGGFYGPAFKSKT